jgi:hypothetical protein
MKKFDVEGNIVSSSIVTMFDCSRHGKTPADPQIERFIQLCREFSSMNPNEIIGKIHFIFH